jgi:hypothetical protein
MKKQVAVVLVVLLCGSALLVWYQRQQLEIQRAKVGELAGQLEAMRDEAALRAETQPAELKRLRGQEAELARLRNEVTQLRGQLKAAGAAKAEGAKTAATSKAAQENTAPFETYEATNHAVMAWKQTLVTGGWTTKPGWRMLVFSQPESVVSKENTSQILVQNKILEVSEEVLAQAGLGSLKSDDKQSSAQLLLSPNQSEGILKQFEKNEGVKMLSAPRVQTSDGVPATITVGQSMPLPSGEQVFVGKTLHLDPRVSADGESVDLIVSSQLRIPNKEEN